jgi:hypothetical protein
MNNVKNTIKHLTDSTLPRTQVIVSDIKMMSSERNQQIHFNIEYPKLTQGEINSPFALQGWLLGGVQIQSIEVSQAGIGIVSVPVSIRRPDIARRFNFDESDDRFGFFSHLNPYLLPEQFELEVNAVTADAEKILLCVISGQRPPLTSCDLTPLLLTTLGRTGSTALLGTLGMHPKVAVYKPFDQEARYISYYTQMFKTLSSVYSWQAPLAAISEYVTQDQLLGRNVPSDDLLHYSVYSEMWSNFYQQYMPDIFKFCTGQLSQLYHQVAALNGNESPQWIAEKFVPGNEVLEVKTVFPAAREIVLVRDPRDVYCSILSFIEKKGQFGFGRECFHDNHSYLTEAFIPSVMQLYRYWKTNADTVLLVRYEDMVNKPEQTFHKICEHIGIDSTPETISRMLIKASETSNDRQKEHQTSASIANSIARFKSNLSQSDIRLMEDSLNEALTEFGYDLYVTGKKSIFHAVQEKLSNVHSKFFRGSDASAINNKSASEAVNGLAQGSGNLHHAEAALLAKNGAIAIQAGEIRRLNTTLVAKDSAISTQTEEIRRLNTVLVAKDSAIATQAEEIRRLNSILTKSST